MRKIRFGAVAASAALASVTVLGAGTAMAQEGDGDPNRASITSGDNYTMTATQTGQCEVTFTLDSLRDEDYGNWRADYRVGEEDPITSQGGSRGDVYRPVVGSNDGIARAIEGRDDPYDFDANSAIVNLTEERRVPYADGDPSKSYSLPGVEANETGEHVITFGVYQGPPAYDAEIYNLDGKLTVTGCPILEPEPEPTLPERISSEFNLPDFSELSSNLSS